MGQGWHASAACSAKLPLVHAVKLKVMFGGTAWYCCALFETETDWLLALGLVPKVHVTEDPSTTAVALATFEAPMRHRLDDDSPVPNSVTFPPLAESARGAIAVIVGAEYIEQVHAGLRETLSVVTRRSSWGSARA